MAIAEKTKERHEEAMADLGKLQKQAAKREAPTQTTVPTTEELTPEPAGIDTPQPEPAHTTKARHEGTAPATTNTPPEQHKEKTTLPEPRPIYVTQQEASDTPNTTETQPSPTTLQPPVPRYTNEPTIEGLPTDQPELTQAPEDILGILGED